MKLSVPSAVLLFLLLLGLLSFSLQTYAIVESTSVLENILDRYRNAATAWAAVITNRAFWLFWMLVVISMVWTFGLMAIRRADLG